MSNSAIFRNILVKLILCFFIGVTYIYGAARVWQSTSVLGYTHKDVWVAVTEISLAECEMHCVCLRASFDKI